MTATALDALNATLLSTTQLSTATTTALNTLSTKQAAALTSTQVGSLTTTQLGCAYDDRSAGDHRYRPLWPDDDHHRRPVDDCSQRSVDQADRPLHQHGGQQSYLD